jgi:hypothetical protein
MQFAHSISRVSTTSSFNPWQGCGHAENQRVKEKSKTSPVEDMRYVGNYGEGISRSCPKTHGIKSNGLNFDCFLVFIVYT